MVGLAGAGLRHQDRAGQGRKVNDGIGLELFLRVVERIAERFGVRIGPLESQPWGMRDFVLFDPAGVLNPGKVLAPAKNLEEMSRIVFNDYVDAALSAAFVAVVLAMVVYGCCRFALTRRLP